MYQNTVALPRLDLVGALRTEDMSLDDYIAHQVLPVFPVDKKAANIPRMLITDDQVLSLKRGPKAAFQRFEGSVDSVGYNCVSSGIEEPMSAEDYDVIGQDRAEQNATMRGMHAVLRARDYALAAALTGATGETLFSGQVTTATGSVAWDQPTGVPITDIAAADLALTTRVGTGKRTLIMGYGVLNKLQMNAQIRSSYRNIVGINEKQETYRKLSVESIAQVLGVDEILVGAGRYNSATKGQTAVKAFIWPSTYALLIRGVVDPQNLTEPCLGRMFSWDQADGELITGGAMDQNDPLHGLMVETYRDEPIKSDVVRVEEYIDPKILNVKAGQLIKSL